MMQSMLVSVVLSATAAAQTNSADPHPVRHDRTGIAWQVPFEAARALALESKRLLAIKPVAFGTTPSGCW
jgi:hypothetical protein